MSTVHDPTLRRYWFTFTGLPPISVLALGCGITARDVDDALALLRDSGAMDDGVVVRDVIEDVDVTTLDAGHVRPNMGVVVWRGIWFPQGYEILDIER